MSQAIAGSFACGPSIALGQTSPQLVIPTGVTSAKLTLTGLDASNTVKTRKSINNGATYVDQVTYNSDQAAVAITVVAGEHWDMTNVAQQALKTIAYKFSVES